MSINHYDLCPIRGLLFSVIVKSSRKILGSSTGGGCVEAELVPGFLETWDTAPRSPAVTAQLPHSAQTSPDTANQRSVRQRE